MDAEPITEEAPAPLDAVVWALSFHHEPLPVHLSKVGYLDERAPLLRYASFSVAAIITVASLVRIVRTTLHLRKR